MDVEKLIELNDKLAGAPVGVLVFFVSISIGYAVKATKRIPNNIIPTCVIAAAAVLFMLGAPGAEAGTPLRVWLVCNFCVGTVVGLAAWLAHRVVLKRVEKRLGLFAKPGEDDTDRFARDDLNAEPKRKPNQTEEK